MATKLSLPSDVPVLSVWIERPDLDDDSALVSLLAFAYHLNTLRKCCPVELEIHFTVSQNGRSVPMELLEMIRDENFPIKEAPSCTTLAIPVTIPR